MKHLFDSTVKSANAGSHFHMLSNLSFSHLPLALHCDITCITFILKIYDSSVLLLSFSLCLFLMLLLLQLIFFLLYFTLGWIQSWTLYP